MQFLIVYIDVKSVFSMNSWEQERYCESKIIRQKYVIYTVHLVLSGPLNEEGRRKFDAENSREIKIYTRG
jgi:hypothetical protein